MTSGVLADTKTARVRREITKKEVITKPERNNMGIFSHLARKDVSPVEKKPDSWNHYCFVDHESNKTHEIWHHPTCGYVDMFINGQIVGKSKKDKK